MVVVNFISNDTQLPNYIQRSPTDLSASFLIDFIVGRLSPSTLSCRPSASGPCLRSLQTGRRYVATSQSYKVVGWGAVQRPYLELAELGKTHHFRVVLLAFPMRDDIGLKYAREAGFEVCDFQPRLDIMLKERR